MSFCKNPKNSCVTLTNLDPCQQCLHSPSWLYCTNPKSAVIPCAMHSIKSLLVDVLIYFFIRSSSIPLQNVKILRPLPSTLSRKIYKSSCNKPFGHKILVWNKTANSFLLHLRQQLAQYKCLLYIISIAFSFNKNHFFYTDATNRLLSSHVLFVTTTKIVS